MVFVCENNFYSVYTHIKDRQPQHRKLFKLAQALGAKSNKFNQDNPYNLYMKFKNIFHKVRKNPYPHFIEIETYRYLEHCGPNDDTHLGYRTDKELKHWKKKDPLIFSRGFLLKKNIIKKSKINLIDKKIKNSVDIEFNSIKNLKKPSFSKIKGLVYKK